MTRQPSRDGPTDRRPSAWEPWLRPSAGSHESRCSTMPTASGGRTKRHGTPRSTSVVALPAPSPEDGCGRPPDQTTLGYALSRGGHSTVGSCRQLGAHGRYVEVTHSG